MVRRKLQSGRWIAVLSVAALAASAAWPINWWGRRDNREGLVAMVRNRAILFPKDGVAKPLELNDAFQVEDQIKTRENSAARILFMEDSFLNVGANTTYVLTKSRYDDVTGARDVGFGLASGKVRLAVGRLFGRGSASVETPTAVVGVKGTDLIVGFDEELRRTLVLVFQGIAEVTSKNPQLEGVVTTVSAGNFTEVGEGAAPPAVQEAPPEMVEENVESTDVSPDPERTAPEVEVAEAPPAPPAVEETGAVEVTIVAETTGGVAGGTSDPTAVQSGGGGGTGLDQPPILPPPVTSVPPDQCPGCPP